MNEIALSVRSVGKVYSRTSNAKVGIFGRERQAKDQFWALQDVSFDVTRGVGLGIIGGNGAGKSTLLKILARIALPSRGEVEVFGKVNSLLEVGTGFQPELSGRENIYLNGSILGMNRQDIDSVFDEIVDFSGVRDFIDMPVKHYSSGMYSRLAFSVAANVTGDILLIDEVLSVGDAEFRRKCLGRMNSLLNADERTVLFVSHSMESVMRFCSKALWLDHGRVRAFGDSEGVVSEYLRHVNQLNAVYLAPIRPKDQGSVNSEASSPKLKTSSAKAISTEMASGFSPAASIMSVLVSGSAGKGNSDIIKREDKILVKIKCEMTAISYLIHPVIHLHCMPRAGILEETHVFTSVGEPMPRVAGLYTVNVEIPSQLLTVGQYYISVALVTRARPQIRHCKLERVVTFQVIDLKYDDGSFMLEQLKGVIQPKLYWSCNPMSIE